MCPLILNPEKVDWSTPTRAFDPTWMQEIAQRCLLAQNCLSTDGYGDAPEWHALAMLLGDDVPKLLDQIAQVSQTMQPLTEVPKERFRCPGNNTISPGTHI